jgi:subtilisin family serine protease
LIFNKTPTKAYASSIYSKFGVQSYHDQGIYGQGVSVYLIDMGLSNAKAKSIHMRHISGPKKALDEKGPSSAKHGAFVAAIVGQRPEESNEKVPGVAPQAQIYAADVCSGNGTIYTSTLIAAIRDAIDLSVDIISISLGTTVYSQSLENAVKDAVARGILVVAASGNCSCRTYEFPAACDSAISVASMDLDRIPSPFNTRNDSVSIFAPGHNIQVGHKNLSGTSFAVPFASGLLALELSKRRKAAEANNLSKSEAIAFLRRTLGLGPEHTYSNDTWTGRASGGSFAEPSIMDHLTALVVFNLISAAVGLFLFGMTHGISKGRESCSIRPLKKL